MDVKACVIKNLASINNAIETRRFLLDVAVVQNAALQGNLLTVISTSITDSFAFLANKEFKLYWKDEDNDMVSISVEKEMAHAVKKMSEKGQLVKFYIIQKIQTPATVHETVSCDECQVGPIVGFRYKCVECPNYDLCGHCENAGFHSHHNMLRINTPMNMNHGLDRFLKRRLARRLAAEASSFQKSEGCPFMGSSDEEPECEKRRRHHKDDRKDFHHHGRRHHRPNLLSPFGDVARAATSAACNSAYAAADSRYLRKIGQAVANLLDPLGVAVDVEVRNEGEVKKETKQQEAETSTNEPTTQPEPALAPVNLTDIIQQITSALAQQHMDQKQTQQQPSEPGWTVLNNTNAEESVRAPFPPPTQAPSQNMYPDLTPPAPVPPPSSNPMVQQGLKTLIEMGFKDDNGILTNLLQIHNGDIYKVMDILSVIH